MKIRLWIYLFLFSLISQPLFAQEIKDGARITPVVKVVQACASSVVSIATEKIVFLRQHPFWGRGYGNAMDLLFQNYFDPSSLNAVRLKNLGSGVIVKEEGLIVTNAHVVNMATQIFVILSDGSSVEGKVVLVNQTDDLALIKIIPPHVLKPIPLANPDDIMIGETVVAIGNPYGLENSVSVGVISGKNRSFAMPDTRHVFHGLLQTDAPINIGNSGGALINLDGELTGINLAVVQNAQNIGFAVPAKKIQDGINYYVQKRIDQAPQADNKEASNPIPIPVKIHMTKSGEQ